MSGADRCPSVSVLPSAPRCELETGHDGPHRGGGWGWYDRHNVDALLGETGGPEVLPYREAVTTNDSQPVSPTPAEHEISAESLASLKRGIEDARAGRVVSLGSFAAEMVPNPGSDAALDMGCKCPVLDNNHGRGNGPFWYNADCPVHASEFQPGEELLVTRVARGEKP